MSHMTNYETRPTAEDDPAADPCAWCGFGKMNHKQAEAAGRTHHRWAADKSGGMTVVENNTPGNQPVSSGGPDQRPIIIAPAPDLALRKLLLDMGVLTREQYEGLYSAQS